MDNPLDICIKKVMMKKINTNKTHAKAQPLTTRKMEYVNLWKATKDRMKLAFPAIGTLIFLSLWIGLSLQYKKLYLNEALMCSTIIVSILFLRAAEQNGDLKEQKTFKKIKLSNNS